MAISRHDIDPTKPGHAPICIDHQEALEETQRAQGAMVAELADVQREIGEVPDPTQPPEERSGAGIKGALARILQQLEALTSSLKDLSNRVDELAHRRNTPPTASTAAWSKRVGWVLLIVALGAREARTLYTEITGAQASTPAQRLTP